MFSGLSKVYDLTNQPNANYRLQIVLYLGKNKKSPVYLTWDNFKLLNSWRYQIPKMTNFHYSSAQDIHVVNVMKYNVNFFATWDRNIFSRSKSWLDSRKDYQELVPEYKKCIVFPNVNKAGGGWWFSYSWPCMKGNGELTIDSTCDSECNFVNLNAKVPYYPGIVGITGVQMKMRPIP